MELYIAYEHDREMVTHARVEIGRLKKKVGGMKQVV
jgi:hypothetical protein